MARPDEAIQDWCARKFPVFSPSVNPRGDWMGVVKTPTSPVPEVGCSQWFQVHIVANGQGAFCCIDSDGRHGSGMNVCSSTILEIYNDPGDETSAAPGSTSARSFASARAVRRWPE